MDTCFMLKIFYMLFYTRIKNFRSYLQTSEITYNFNILNNPIDRVLLFDLIEFITI